MVKIDDLFDAHLNVWWLRPGNVVWDTMASWLVRQSSLKGPILDLGSGNGIFSFLTAGGQFSVDFDWFINVDAGGTAKDIYNVQPRVQSPTIVKKPDYQIDVAFDYKGNLLSQAATLGLYGRTVQGDANRRTSFANESFQTIFSNILYWLKDPVVFLKECHRILRPKGQLLLCMPDPLYYAYCESYRYKELRSTYLQLLNGTRADCIRWTMTLPKMKSLAKKTGFRIVRHHGYLTRRTLSLWDMELRASTRPIARAVNGADPKRRAEIKSEYIHGVRPIFRALLDEERATQKGAGFHLFVLEKQGS